MKDDFATIDLGSLANVTGGYVSGTGSVPVQPQQPISGGGGGGLGSGQGHHHHHHHGNGGGCGGGGGGNGGVDLGLGLGGGPTWGGPNGNNGTVQVRDPGRYHPE